VYQPITGRHVALVYAGVCSLFCIHLFLLGFYSGKKHWVVCHAYGIYRITIYIIFYKGVCSVCWCMQYHLTGKKCDTVLLFLGRLKTGTPAYTAYTLCNTVFLRGQGSANQTGTRGNGVRFSQFPEYASNHGFYGGGTRL
jgi:hypothetical protein